MNIWTTIGYTALALAAFCAYSGLVIATACVIMCRRERRLIRTYSERAVRARATESAIGGE